MAEGRGAGGYTPRPSAQPPRLYDTTHVPRCAECGGPMAPAMSEPTHPACDPLFLALTSASTRAQKGGGTPHH